MSHPVFVSTGSFADREFLLDSPLPSALEVDHFDCPWLERRLLRNPPIIVWRTLRVTIHTTIPNSPIPNPFLSSPYSVLQLCSPCSQTNPPLYPHCRDFGSALVRITICFLSCFSIYAFAFPSYTLHVSQIWVIRGNYECKVHLFEVVCWFLVAFSQVRTPGRDVEGLLARGPPAHQSPLPLPHFLRLTQPVAVSWQCCGHLL